MSEKDPLEPPVGASTPPRKGLPGADRYRRSGEASDPLGDTLERANRSESLHALLLEMGAEIPPDAASWKFHCPWDHEHTPSAMRERSARYYATTDSAYCFEMHGLIDPVRIRAREWKVSPTVAAKRMVVESSRGHLRGWYVARWADLQLAQEEAAEQPSFRNAVSALQVRLRGAEGYMSRQYDPEVRAVLEAALGRLSGSEDVEAMRLWVEETYNEVRSKL